MSILRFVLVRNSLCTPRRVGRFLHKHDVRVNGERVFSDERKFSFGSDILCVDGKIVPVKKEIYLMMNKQKMRTCSRSDGEHATVYDDVPLEIRDMLHTVGRLDADTEGLLLLTTDGVFSHKVSSPMHHVPKTYEVTLKNSVGEDEQKRYAKKCSEGIAIPPFRGEKGFFSLPAELTFTAKNKCTLTLHEGKFHQVKRMFHALGNEVTFLRRLSIGSLVLDETLAPGKTRVLTESEIEMLWE